MSCPMVAVHQGSMQLAVGRAGWAHSATATAGDGSPPPGLSGEPISVHDLTSGRKKRAMHFRSGDIALSQHACLLAVHPCSGQRKQCRPRRQHRRRPIKRDGGSVGIQPQWRGPGCLDPG